MFHIWIVVGYLALLFAVAITKMRTVKTQEDFMVAGRKAPMLLLVGTLICTWIGSGSLFGSAGLGFRLGFSAVWFSAGAWVGIALVYFLAPRVRRLAEFTVSDILEKRYNKWARVLGTLTVIIAYLTIAGYQFRGGGPFADSHRPRP
jgi:SSS family solute:Na+ symporter/sodium/proline symporter